MVVSSNNPPEKNKNNLSDIISYIRERARSRRIQNTSGGVSGDGDPDSNFSTDGQTKGSEGNPEEMARKSQLEEERSSPESLSSDTTPKSPNRKMRLGGAMDEDGFAGQNNNASEEARSAQLEQERGSSGFDSRAKLPNERMRLGGAMDEDGFMGKSNSSVQQSHQSQSRGVQNSDMSEEERKAQLENDRRLRVGAAAKIATGDRKNVGPEEMDAAKRTNARDIRELSKDRKLIRQEGKKVAKKQVTKAVAKKTLQVLISTLPVWGPILLMIAICVFGFIILMYYTCEGSGFMSWLLKKTAIGSLCSM